MGFVGRTLELGSQSHRFAVYCPRTIRRPLPVILYLHGLGRGGRDGERQSIGGLGEMIRGGSEEFPFLVVFPQSPDDTEFVGAVAELCLGVLRAARAEFDGDPARTYVVGASMGGHGAYHLALRQPGLFAAMVVTCGSPRLPDWRRSQLGESADEVIEADPDSVAAGLGDIPIWIFHGTADETVPVGESRRIVGALEARGSPVRYTEFPDGGHEACCRAFAQPGLWSWLASHRLDAGE